MADGLAKVIGVGDDELIKNGFLESSAFFRISNQQIGNDFEVQYGTPFADFYSRLRRFKLYVISFAEQT